MDTEVDQQPCISSSLQAMKGRLIVIGLVSLVVCISLVVAVPGAKLQNVGSQRPDAEAILRGDGSGTTKWVF